MKRENPWHIRLPKAEHHHWFKNLVEIHELTHSWITDLKVDRPSHRLHRGLSPEATQNLWMLESLNETSVDQFLDSSQPDELLQSLEKTIWAVQAWTLQQILGESENSEQSSSPDSRGEISHETLPIQNLLEQISWKAGRLQGERKWNTAPGYGQFDLVKIYFALQDSPFAGYPRTPHALVRRATLEEVEVELFHCPHQLAFPEIKNQADLICRLHTQWRRGFIYSLNQGVCIDHRIESPRCYQRWFFG